MQAKGLKMTHNSKQQPEQFFTLCQNHFLRVGGIFKYILKQLNQTL